MIICDHSSLGMWQRTPSRCWLLKGGAFCLLPGPRQHHPPLPWQQPQGHIPVPPPAVWHRLPPLRRVSQLKKAVVLVARNELGSISHYLQGFYTSQVVSRISSNSSVRAKKNVPSMAVLSVESWPHECRQTCMDWRIKKWNEWSLVEWKRMEWNGNE